MSTLKVDTIKSDTTPTVTISDGLSVTGVTTSTGDLSISDKIIHTGDTHTAIRFAGNDIITAEIAGTETFRIDSTGLKLADNIIHSGDTDTKIRFPSADTISAETGGSESLRIDSGGRLLIGTTSQVHSGTHKVQIASTDANAAITLNRYSNNANAAYLHFTKSRSGTIGGNTIVQNGDLLGRIYFQGNGGDGNYAAAYVECYVDGSPGTNDMPGRLSFLTSADGSPTPLERLRIDSSGIIKFDKYGGTAGKGRVEFGNSGEQYVEGYDTGNAGSSSYLAIGSNTSERVRIDNLGHVGVGTAVPNVGGHDKSITISNLASSARSALNIQGNTANCHACVEMRNNGTLVSGIYSRGTDRLQFGTGASGTVRGQFTQHGLNFHSDTAEANALDDYEVGTWSPSHNSGTEPGWHTKVGQYVKIGSLVHLDMWLQASGTTSSTDAIEITVPFACSNTTGSRPTSAAARCYSLQNWGSYRSAYGFMTSGNSLLNMMWVSAGGNPASMGMNLWRNGAEIHCSISYRTNA